MTLPGALAATVPCMDKRSAVFLLPKALDGFILEDLVRPLVDTRNVIALEPGRLPAGAFMRLPGPAARMLASARARSAQLPDDPAVFILMHPVLWPLAEALLDRNPQAELWYSIWDRYDHAPDADQKTRAKLAALHAFASARADWRFAVSGRLAEIEADAGRPCDVVTLPHDGFPAPDPESSVVASALGHLGRRTDWPLLQSLVSQMPDLTLLLIGQVYKDEAADPLAMEAVLAAPNCISLGALSDDGAARIIGMSDVCLLPFLVDPFNDAGLPQRILKAARLGRRTFVPRLAGSLTQKVAVTVCEQPADWLYNLRELQAKTGHSADRQLRDWALDQNQAALLRPLRERLRQLGVRPPD